MRIAFITFEFPPAVAIGGIGAYAFEAVRMLAERGQDLEVFCAGPETGEQEVAFGVRVNRVSAADRDQFRTRVLPVFLDRHRSKPFDVLESPEIGAEALEIARHAPGVARVVKLHTPSFLVQEIGTEPPTWLERLRFSLGALRRGRIGFLQQAQYRREDDVEFEFTRQAHEVVAPSQAIANRIGKEWGLDPSRLVVFPHPIHPRQDLLSLPVSSRARTIGFLGRLESRKGIRALAMAIPDLLHQAPELRFRFIGPTWPYRQTDMVSWMKAELRRESEALAFTGSIAPDQLASELAQCDVMVLPSRWENFPLACMESMLSGRAVIASSAGGMAEMIEDGACGLLVPPDAPTAIARAVLHLVKNPHEVGRLGAAGRDRILNWLAPDRIAPLQLAGYERAVQRSRNM